MKKLLLLLIIFLAYPALADPSFPPLQGKPLLDAAQLLSPADEAALDDKLTTISKQAHHQVMVLTVASLGGYTIAEYGYKAGRFYGIGNRDSSDGVLITVAPKEHKVRIDVGTGMESLLTDGQTHDITENIMKPQFKNGHWAQGINDGVDQVGAAINKSGEGQQFIAHRQFVNQQSREQSGGNSWLWGLLVTFVSALVLAIGSRIRRARKLKQAEAEKLRKKEEQTAKGSQPFFNTKPFKENQQNTYMTTQPHIPIKTKPSPVYRPTSSAPRYTTTSAAPTPVVNSSDSSSYYSPPSSSSYSSSDDSSSSSFSSYDSGSSSSSYDSGSSSSDFSGGGGSFSGGGSDSSW